MPAFIFGLGVFGQADSEIDRLIVRGTREHGRFDGIVLVDEIVVIVFDFMGITGVFLKKDLKIGIFDQFLEIRAGINFCKIQPGESPAEVGVDGGG